MSLAWSLTSKTTKLLKTRFGNISPGLCLSFRPPGSVSCRPKLPMQMKSSEFSGHHLSPGLPRSPVSLSSTVLQGHCSHPGLWPTLSQSHEGRKECVEVRLLQVDSLVPALSAEACLCSIGLFLSFMKDHLIACGTIPGLSTTPRVNPDGQHGLWVMMCQRRFLGREKCSIRGVC